MIVQIDSSIDSLSSVSSEDSDDSDTSYNSEKHFQKQLKLI
jgi:hypothetical protein